MIQVGVCRYVTAQAGCDSIATLNLTINHLIILLQIRCIDVGDGALLAAVTRR